MSRNKNERNAFVSMGGKLLVGAVIGGIIGGVFGNRNMYAWFQSAADSFLEMIVINYVAIMVVLAIAMLILNLGCYVKLKSYCKEAIETEDEESCDVLDDKIENITTVSLNGNGFFFILLFMIFVLNCNLGGVQGWSTILLYFIPVLMYPLFYILTIGVLKKYDPSKNGNPGSMSFQKDWLESCDEAEQMQIYKLGYQCHKGSSYILVFGFAFTAITALIFNVGAFAILITGGMWLIQTVVSGYYNIKYKKKGF